MTGGFNVLTVGSSHQAASKRVCSESTGVMSCLVVLCLLNTLQNRKKRTVVHTNRIEPRGNHGIKKKESAASMCVNVRRKAPLHWLNGFHDYSWGNHSSGMMLLLYIHYTHTQFHTLRAFWAGSLDPMTIRPGPPMLQKLFRCRPSNTGTVDTA